MVQQAVHTHELVSALIDGEVQGDELADALALLEVDAQARAYWHACHVTGDALRDTRLVLTGASDADFLSRLQLRLGQDQASGPGQLSQAVPGMSLPASSGAMANPGVPAIRDAANEARRWKQVAVLATMGLAAVLGWQLLLNPDHAGPAWQVALESTAAEGPQMLRDPQLDALLAAHRQLGGATALLKPTGFLRNATFEPLAP